MKKILVLGAFTLMVACDAAPPPAAVVQPAVQTGELPANVLAALPRGVPASAVQKDANGCYSFVNAIELVVLREGGLEGGAPICDAA